MRLSMGSGTHHGDSRPKRARRCSRFCSMKRTAPRTPASISSWWRPSAVAISSARPASGATWMRRRRPTTACSTPACRSSSRSTSTAPAMAALAWRASVSALAGTSNQVARRDATWTPRSFSAMTGGARKFSSTKDPSARPSWSLRVGMIAVWGIGRPSGRRNSAVTANQSARAPTMAASAVART